MAKRDDAISGSDFSGNPSMEIEFEFEIPQEANANEGNPHSQHQNMDDFVDFDWRLQFDNLTSQGLESEQNLSFTALLASREALLASREELNPVWTSTLDRDWGYIYDNSNQNSCLPGGYSSGDNLSSEWSEALAYTWQNSGIGCSKDKDVSGSVPSTPTFVNHSPGSGTSTPIFVDRSPGSGTCMPSFVNHSSNVATASHHGSYDQVSNTNNSSLYIELFGEYPPQNSDARFHQDKKKGAQPLNKRKKHFIHKLGDKQDYSIEHHSSNDIQQLSSESDGDEALSSESNKSQSELPVEVNEKKHEVNCQVPETGMVFSSQEVAYQFYKNYAAAMGFSVRKGKVQRLSNGNIRKRDFYCSKQGFRSQKQSDKTTKYRRKETRTGCEAMIQITFENGKWVILRVVLEHNHDLENPGQRHMVDSWTKSSDTHSIHTVIEVGIAKEAGTANCVGLLRTDYGNYLRDRKLNSLRPEDGQSLINYLRHMQVGDPSFFYTVQVDAENRVTNFFWRDGRSEMDYDYFGDVLILDTTFRMDIYGMICAPFLGLNHHRNYVLFGCAFLLDETMDSYIWLFEAFMEAMGNHRPKTIVTDECQAKANAIEVVLPDTSHRLYPEFIFQNAAKHLPTDCGNPGFQNLLNRSMLDCQSREEFESIWDSLLEQYNLRENPWLKSLYLSWDKWSHLSVRKTFSAGIQSSKGAMPIIHVFQNMTGETMSLPKFAEQYEKSAEQWRSKELSEDFNCTESASVMIVPNNEMEKQAADVYTPTMFKLFQAELLACLSVAIEAIASDEMTATFKLTEHTKKAYVVAFNCSDSTVSCSCENFESVGILCLHALRVLNTRNIFQIPPQYILKRWTKHAKSGVVMDDCRGEMADKRNRPLSSCTSRLMHKALNVITKSAAREESRKIAEEYLDKALKKVEDALQAKPIAHCSTKESCQ